MGNLRRARSALGERDPGREAWHRGVRAAIVMPGALALALKVIDSSTMAPFAAFGAMAMLVLFPVSGSRRERVELQAAFVLVGAGLVCLGTLASRFAPVAVVSMALVGVFVIFSGVISSVLAGAGNAMLLSFILPVSLPAPVSAIPDRVAGWLLSGALSVIAVGLLWPESPSPLRGPAARVCRTLATCLRHTGSVTDTAIAEATAAAEGLGSTFLRTPYRPTGLSTEARAVVRLVDELRWLVEVVRLAEERSGARSPAVGAVATAAATVLERCAELLTAPDRPLDGLDRARTALAAATRGMVQTTRPARVPDASELVSGLETAFRAKEAGFMTEQVAANVEVFARASRRSWIERLLGRQPAGFTPRLRSTRERVRTHLTWESTSLHNALRGGAGLGLAVLMARLFHVEHAFWVSLATLTVLRSSALSTGQTFARALAGTTAGFLLGAAIVVAIGTNITLLWFVLPVAVLLAGLIPVAVSFLAGQAAFTVVLFILFNILAPAGWRIGLVRLEDIGLGGAVSLVVGLLFWPRGTGTALGTALAGAYEAGATYLARAVGVAVACCAPGRPSTGEPDRAAALVAPQALAAAAAGRRLDDTFRAYLSERGAKRLPLADVTTLVTRVFALRLAADGVLELWDRDADPSRSRIGAALELGARARSTERWYATLGAALRGQAAVPEVEPNDATADARLLAAVASELPVDPAREGAIVTRIVWTADYLDVGRRLEALLVGHARELERGGILRAGAARRRGRGGEAR